MTPLRILHLDFHRGWGGQPSRILMGSRELARRGHEVAIAAPGDGILAERACAAGLTVFGAMRFYKPKRLLSLARDVVALRRILREFKPDLVHSHGSQDTWTTVLANRFGGPRLPHVLTRHNSKWVACSRANRWLYGRAIDRLVVVSGGVLERYEEFFRRGVLDRAEVDVIPSSIDFARFDAPADRASARRALMSDPGVSSGPGDPSGVRTRAESEGGAHDDRPRSAHAAGQDGAETQDALSTPIVGSFGRLVRDKGQDILLRSWPAVLEARPGALLVLAGTGSEERRLRALAINLGLGDRARFLGFRDDLPFLTAGLDVSVLASVDCDASPAVVKEAMYMRRPVVVTDIGGLREMVEDGVTGLVVPPRDPADLARAILSILDDPAAAARMGERAREVVRTRYSIDALVSSYERVYAEVLQRARTPRP